MRDPTEGCCKWNIAGKTWETLSISISLLAGSPKDPKLMSEMLRNPQLKSKYNY